jgi:chitin disaccharide deacetylase
VSATRRLIVNADDLGLSPGVNRGIMDLAAAGVVTSASLLMNLPATADAVRRATAIDLPLGVHLNLTAGRPLTGPGTSLTRAEGRFGRPEWVVGQLVAGRLRLPEVEREWEAQIEAFLATGLRPSHLDTHVHLHVLPPLAAIVWRLAGRHGIGAVRLQGHGLVLHQVAPFVPPALVTRWRLATGRRPAAAPMLRIDHLLVLTAMRPPPTPRSLAALLRRLPPGLTELVTHPGYVDDELRGLDPLTWAREEEVWLLGGEWWPALLAETGIVLTNFRDAAAGSV